MNKADKAKELFEDAFSVSADHYTEDEIRLVRIKFISEIFSWRHPFGVGASGVR